MIPGVTVVGDLFVTFTLFARDPRGSEHAAVLAMARSARHLR